MSAQTLITQAMEAGVQVRLQGGQLKLIGSEQTAHQWAQRLRPHKAAIIALLEQEQRDLHQQPTNWKVVRDAYYQHHHACPTCICAGRGYGLRCGTGASLWAAYGAINPPFARR